MCGAQLHPSKLHLPGGNPRRTASSRHVALHPLPSLKSLGLPVETAGARTEGDMVFSSPVRWQGPLLQLQLLLGGGLCHSDLVAVVFQGQEDAGVTVVPTSR